jgi:ribosome maturation factor RimP
VRYTLRGSDPIYDSARETAQGLGLDVVELHIFQRKGNVQVKVVAYKPGTMGLDECSRLHRAILPLLESAFPGQDLYVEVSTPGVDRNIRDASEFRHYIGRAVRCFRTDISDWTSGVLVSADETGLVLTGKNGTMPLPYAIIAKAKLDYAQEVNSWQ